MTYYDVYIGEVQASETLPKRIGPLFPPPVPFDDVLKKLILENLKAK